MRREARREPTTAPAGGGAGRRRRAGPRPAVPVPGSGATDPGGRGQPAPRTARVCRPAGRRQSARAGSRARRCGAGPALAVRAGGRWAPRYPRWAECEEKKRRWLPGGRQVSLSPPGLFVCASSPLWDEVCALQSPSRRCLPYLCHRGRRFQADLKEPKTIPISETQPGYPSTDINSLCVTEGENIQSSWKNYSFV
ncbi:uncharacterized protein LOC122152900 isoform X2 [Tyto alba]|uniref:uncharacterized protein LOC122152900 isoform X2 n=1 Tax=Tyto alba TaxID=56313 RepID=UPI001C6657DC|nr:uncharacterized protein LOC122152900 isoform X2 [Tyto alba]